MSDPSFGKADPSNAAQLLLEQHRLTLDNQQSSVILGLLVGAVVVVTLSDDTNRTGLLFWYAALLMCSLLASAGVRRTLQSGMDLSGNRRRHRFLVAKAIAVSGTWGSLAWVTLGKTTSAPDSVLVLAVLAGVLANAVSNHAAMFRLFLLFCAIEVGCVAARLWYIQDTVFSALGWTALLYLASLLGQARNGAKVTRAMMALRFENAELMLSARAEARNAMVAQLKAERADLAKSKFLAAASHDLRQPMHAQGLLLAVLARSDLTPTQRRALDNVASAARASAEMLDTLLDFSRIEAGVVRTSKQPFLLQPLLRRIENELGPLADERGIFYRSRETDKAVLSDPILVEVILRNLVSNAVRYTSEGGVLVAARVRAGELCVEVWDTGVGIEPSQHQAIFEEFHQLGNAERDRRKGLGLGLAIAQGLCVALGHSIQLRSTLGQGSVFRLSLTSCDVMPNEAAEVAPPPAQGAPDLRLDGLHALVIDDDESVRVAMQELLTDWGCRCEVAESQEAALASARRQCPGLVICDYRLRGAETGAQVIAALRQEHGGELAAIMVTGDTAPERLRDAVASGIALLHKPVSADALHARIVATLDVRRPSANSVD